MFDTELNESNLEEYKEQLEFLDDLRESSETNMFGAAPYLQREFGYDRRKAQEVLKFWMNTFNQRHKEE